VEDTKVLTPLVPVQIKWVPANKAVHTCLCKYIAPQLNVPESCWNSQETWPVFNSVI